MPAGRPSEYDISLCEKVIECGKQGMSIEETCVEVGISDDSWYRWSSEEAGHPEFSEAIKEHKSLCHAWWLKHGRTQLENQKFSATLWYMNMKNRFGWKDRSDFTTNEKDLKGDGATIAQIEAAMQNALKK